MYMTRRTFASCLAALAGSAALSGCGLASRPAGPERADFDHSLPASVAWRATAVDACTLDSGDVLAVGGTHLVLIGPEGGSTVLRDFAPSSPQRVAASGGYAYIALDDGSVAAIEISSGEMFWSSVVVAPSEYLAAAEGLSGWLARPLIVGAERLFATFTANHYSPSTFTAALGRRGGHVLWKLPSEDTHVEVSGLTGDGSSMRRRGSSWRTAPGTSALSTRTAAAWSTRGRSGRECAAAPARSADPVTCFRRRMARS